MLLGITEGRVHAHSALVALLKRRYGTARHSRKRGDVLELVRLNIIEVHALARLSLELVPLRLDGRAGGAPMVRKR